MTLVVPDVAEVVILNYITNKAAPQDVTLRLYTNNITPAETDTTATYTEASGSGYAAKPLTAANWTVASGAPSSATYNAAQVFTFTGAISIYGYFLNLTTATTLMWAERAAGAPIVITTSGSSITITPAITGD